MHTGRIGIVSTTGSVYRELFNQLKKLRFLIFIWKLCREKGVYVFRSLKLVIRMEEDDYVDMRKATLLKFNHLYMCNCSSQVAFGDEVILESLYFAAKHTIHQIRSISGYLSR